MSEILGADLVTLTGLARQTIREKLAGTEIRTDGGPRKNASVYESKQALPILYGLDLSGLDLTDERAKLAREQTELVRIKRLELSGESIRLSDVRAEWLSLIGVLKGRMMAMASRIGPEIHPKMDVREIEDLIIAYVHSALQEAADGLRARPTRRADSDGPGTAAEDDDFGVGPGEETPKRRGKRGAGAVE